MMFMEDREIEPYFGVPLRHKVIALLIAVTATSLLFAWLRNKANESASAVLAFDPAVAQRLDPGLQSAKRPAIALADSILNDQAIAGLTNQAHLSSFTAASRIGEFRSGLEMAQPSSTVLKVQFLDSDSGRSAANTNAVAKALAAWTPSMASKPAAAAYPESATAPGAATAPDARTQGGTAEVRSLSASLGQIGAGLAATNRELDHLAGAARAGRSPYRNSRSRATLLREQRLLRAQVNAAEKKLDDLRAQLGQGDAGPGVEGRLNTVQQSLRSILAAGERSAKAHGNAAAISASQVRRQRSRLRNAISVVGKERDAIERTETAHSGPVGASPAAFAPASAPASTAASSSPLQEQTATADSGNFAPQRSSEHPLSLMHLASPTQPAPLMPDVLVGLICGLLYLGGAVWAYRRAERNDDYEEEAALPRRFITSDEPIEIPREHHWAADLPDTEPTPADFETASDQDASIPLDTPDESETSPSAAFPADETAEGSVGMCEEPLTETRQIEAHQIEDRQTETRQTEARQTEARQTEARQTETGRIEAAQPASREENGEMPDPLMDEIRKSLSQTWIGRMFEAANTDPAGEPQQIEQPRQQQSASPIAPGELRTFTGRSVQAITTRSWRKKWSKSDSIWADLPAGGFAARQLLARFELPASAHDFRSGPAGVIFCFLLSSANGSTTFRSPLSPIPGSVPAMSPGAYNREPYGNGLRPQRHPL